ncbi:RNA-directed DNA polymerase, eukaryota, reverse transcriptase zinc-binding domain protein [Tanacetum coccineum]
MDEEIDKGQVIVASSGGDENSSFFHGMLNKNRSQTSIRGVLANGKWTDRPDKMSFPNVLTYGKMEELECDVTKEEVKQAVWDCGTDNSVGPDGFTFGFYRKFWETIESDVYEAVNLRSSRGSILINGSPTEEFQFFKGLKQGDPLSPFLFILIMESLHLSFQRVVDAGLFTGININSSLTLSHMFYADDAVFLGQWNDRNIDTLFNVLECFFRVSGLRINMSKSKIMRVHVEGDLVKNVASKLGCLILKTPFTYLGTKVGGKMSRVQEWQEVVDKVKARLSKWKLKALSIGGRLTLLKSVLSKKAIWLKWSSVLADKTKGGLGVASLYALNRGLLIKWLWRFYNQNSALWVKVVKAIHGEDGKVGSYNNTSSRSCWLNIVKEARLLSEKGINVMDYIKHKLGNGENTLFWEDNWHNVGEGGAELSQLDSLSNLIREVVLVPAMDRYTWSLEGSGEFSVASIRRVIDDNYLPTVSSNTRWIKYLPIKVNIIAWKVKMKALPVHFNLSRRGIDIGSITCPVCEREVETTCHLFFKCSIIRQIVRKISSWWDVPYNEVDSYEEWLIWLNSLRMPVKLKKIFEGVFYVLWWCKWSYRNKTIFEDKIPSKSTIFDDVVSSLFHWCRAQGVVVPNSWCQTPKVVPRQQNGVWHQKCHGTRIQWEWFGIRILVP